MKLRVTLYGKWRGDINNSPTCHGYVNTCFNSQRRRRERKRKKSHVQKYAETEETSDPEKTSREKPQKKRKRKRNKMRTRTELTVLLLPYFTPTPCKWTNNLPNSPIFHKHLRPLSFWKNPGELRSPLPRPSPNIHHMYNPPRYLLLCAHPHDNSWRLR